jgi:hypothetical protein
MDIRRHVRTAVKLFSSRMIPYLLMGAVVAYGSLFTFGLLAGPLIGGLVNAGLMHLRTGRLPGLGEITSGFQNLGHLFLLSLLLLLAWLGMGVVLPVLMVMVWWSYIPILILLVSMATWWLYVPALIVDRRTSLWAAMRASKTRVTEPGGFLPHLGFVVVVLVLPPLAIFGLSVVFPPAGWLHFLVCPFQLLALASAYEAELGQVQPTIELHGNTACSKDRAMS